MNVLLCKPALIRKVRKDLDVEGRWVVGTPPERPVCDYKEAMLLTGLKKTKLYDLFRRGVLRGYRDGEMVRFYRAGLLAYMKERENTPATPPPSRRRPKRATPPNGVRFKFLE